LSSSAAAGDRTPSASLRRISKCVARPHRAGQRTAYRTTAGLEHASGHDHVDRRGDRGSIRKDRQVLAQGPVVAEARIDGRLRFLRQFEGRIAEVVVLQCGDGMRRGSVEDFGGESVACRRRAVEVIGVDAQRQRLPRRQPRLVAVERELQAFGQEFLDPEGEASQRFGRARIEAVLERPATGRRVRGEGALVAVIAEGSRLQRKGGDGAAIGLAQRRIQRLLAADRAPIVVAQQRRDLQRLPRPEQVASRPGVDILRGELASGDREFRQVERGLAERDQRDLAAAACEQDVIRLGAVVEDEVAVSVGGAGREHDALRVHDLHFDARARIAVGERSGMQPQGSGLRASVDPQVADVVVGGLELPVEHAGALHHRDVEAGVAQLGNGLDRQEAHAALVRSRLEREAVRVHRLGDARKRAHLPVAALLRIEVVGEELRERAFLDAQEFDVDFGDVHRDDRQAVGLARRQHAALAREAHRRRKIARVDLPWRQIGQGAAVGGGESCLRRDGIGLVRLHERKTQAAVVVGEHPASARVRATRTGHAQQFVEGLGRSQRLREAQQQGRAAVERLAAGFEDDEVGGLFLDRLRRGNRRHRGRRFPACGQAKAENEGQGPSPNRHGDAHATSPPDFARV
jgi:hypothetical protein